jgi:type IV secretory pathway VirB3-like protein
MCCNFFYFHFVRESIYLAISVLIIISCFKAKSSINKINDLAVKTSFTENNTFTPSLYINIYLEEKSNITEFFDKFGLKEGQKISNNKSIENSLLNIKRLSLAIAIILIILPIFSIVPIAILCFFGIDREGFALEFVGKIAIFILKARFIIIFILLAIYVGFEISYKNTFENKFFSFYENDIDDNIKVNFKNYYESLFDFKTTFIYNIILFPTLLVYIFGFVYYFYDPCACLWKKWYF